MEIKEFVVQLYHKISEYNIDEYKALYEGTTIEEASDCYWKKALAFFQKLSDEEKECFFSIIRQVAVDTTANILSILDNSSYLKNKDNDLVLTFENKPDVNLSGDLVDIFLGYDEEQDN